MKKKTSRKKTTRATGKPSTHFEQVPVAIVRKIAELDAPQTKETEPGNVIIEPASRKTEPYSLPMPAVDRIAGLNCSGVDR